MGTIEEILKSERKPKEKTTLLSESIKKDKNLIGELFECFKAGSDVDKGTCAHAMKLVSAEKPELFKLYIDDLIEYITYKAPRVKWGIPETIGNIANKYPQEVEKAVPNLLINTKDKSTVVRWCAAFALTEIAKNNPKIQKKLIPKFSEIIKKEGNNGVKNVYLKTLNVLT
jgi:hypothetical protein